MPGTATAFSLRLCLHYKAARAGGVIRQSNLSELMKTWLDEVSASLDEAIKIAESERIPLQSLYRLAPALFALKHGIQDEGLIQQMLDEADAQVTEDASGMCQPHLNQPAIN